MPQQIRFSIWFSVILLAAFAVGYWTWTESLSDQYTVQNSPPPPLFAKEGKGELQGWQIYRNEEYGFEVKYPESWFEKSGDAVRFSNVADHQNLTEENLREVSSFTIIFHADANESRLLISQWFSETFNLVKDDILSQSEVVLSGQQVLRIEVSEVGRKVHYYIPKEIHILEIVFNLDQSKFIKTYNQILSTFRFID